MWSNNCSLAIDLKNMKTLICKDICPPILIFSLFFSFLFFRLDKCYLFILKFTYSFCWHLESAQAPLENSRFQLLNFSTPEFSFGFYDFYLMSHCQPIFLIFKTWFILTLTCLQQLIWSHFLLSPNLNLQWQFLLTMVSCMWVILFFFFSCHIFLFINWHFR